MDPSENSCWSKLPADIQADILSRLRGKELIRYKLVCWGWYNVISYICLPRVAPPSPEASFCGIILHHRVRDVQKQHNGARMVSSSILGLASIKSKFRVERNAIEDRLYQNYRPEDIQDCCNGLLLVLQHENDGVRYSVYNPTTGQSIHVPPPPHSPHNRTTQCCFASLAFDPTKSLHYRIICTPGGNITNPLKVDTFSSQIGKWLGCVVNIDSVIDGVEWIHRSAYLDGRIYRLLKTNYLACIDAKRSQLLRVHVIELPNFCGEMIYIDDNSCSGSIGISRERLHYSTRDRSGSTILVYMLKDDGSWLLKHTISFDDLLVNPSSYVCAELKRIVNNHLKETWFNFYVFHPNCDTLFLITPNLILSYSPEEKFLELCYLVGGEIAVGQIYSFPYSHCPIRLWNAFQRTCANLDQHLPKRKPDKEKQCTLDLKDHPTDLDQKFEQMHHLHPLCL